MKDIVKIGLHQTPPAPNWHVAERVDHMLYLMEECLKHGADIVFMTERWQYLNEKEDSYTLYTKYAQSTREKCVQLAKKYHAYVAPWDYEVDDQGNVYNMMYILDRNGNEVGCHRKTHITHGETINTKLTRGNRIEVFELDIGKVGIIICFEAYFPEVAGVLGRLGAQIVLYPLAGDNKRPADQWEIKLRARAIDNSMFIAPQQRSLPDPENGSTAWTGLVDPSGRVLGKLYGPSQWCVLEIHPQDRKKDYIDGGILADMRNYMDISRNPTVYDVFLKEDKVTDWNNVLEEK